jgi:hypothetical protein
MSHTSDELLVKKIKIPETLQKHPLFLGFAFYSHSNEFNGYSISTQLRYSETFRLLIKFALNDPVKSDANDIGLVTPNFKNFLRGRGLTANPVIEHLSRCKTVLKYVCDPQNTFACEDNKQVKLALIRDHVRVPERVKYQIRNSLIDIFQNDQYSDEDILISLRSVCMWYLNKIGSLRKRFFSEFPELAKEVLNFDTGESIYKSDLMNFGNIEKKETIEKKVLMAKFINALNMLDEKIFKEFVFFNNCHYQKLLFQGKEILFSDMEDEIEAMFGTKASCIKLSQIHNHKFEEKSWVMATYKSPFVNKKTRMRTLKIFPPGALYTATYAELMMLSWLLASERIQSSSQDNIRVSDIRLVHDKRGKHPKSMQLTWIKDRSRGKKFGSAIYHSNEAFFEAVMNILFVNEKSQLLKSPSRPNMLLPILNDHLCRKPMELYPSHLSPIFLLAIPGTVTNDCCRNEGYKPEAFLELLNYVVRKRVKLEPIISPKCNRYKFENVQVVRLANAPKITTSTIAQSRALFEDIDTDDLTVTASLSAHSVSTHKGTYADRVDISKRNITKKSNFGEVVGDEMISMAKSIAGFRDNVEILKPYEIYKRIGISCPSLDDEGSLSKLNDFLILAEKEGFDIGIIGDISNNYDTFIIQSPITAALITAYIEHIDSELPNISVDSSEKAKLVYIHKIYLDQLLSCFPGKVITQGRQINLNCQFPFPNLT